MSKKVNEKLDEELEEEFEDDFDDDLEDEFVWKKATHIGKCKKCVKQGRKHDKELNKKDLCREHARGKRFVIAVILILIAFVIFLILGMSTKWFDPNAASGPYTGAKPEDLNAQVAEGEMNVSIANTIVFHDGTENPGTARIYNNKANHVDQRVTIFLKDTKEMVYQSGAIRPDQHIDTIVLSKHLDPGQYKAIAVFTGYKPGSDNAFIEAWNNLINNHPKTGQLNAEINIWVE